jgi:hypothetical protein
MQNIPYLTGEQAFKIKNEREIYKVLDGPNKILFFYRYKNYYKVKYKTNKYKTNKYYVFNIFEENLNILLKVFNNIIYLINNLDYTIKINNNFFINEKINLDSTIIKYKKLRYISNIELKPKILKILSINDFIKNYLQEHKIEYKKLIIINRKDYIYNLNYKTNKRLETIEEESIFQDIYNLLEEVNDIINNISN